MFDEAALVDWALYRSLLLSSWPLPMDGEKYEHAMPRQAG